jgi:hypothetical protein
VQNVVIDATIIWDLDNGPDGNFQHIAEHGVTVDEVNRYTDALGLGFKFAVDESAAAGKDG